MSFIYIYIFPQTGRALGFSLYKLGLDTVPRPMFFRVHAVASVASRCFPWLRYRVPPDYPISVARRGFPWLSVAFGGFPWLHAVALRGCP